VVGVAAEGPRDDLFQLRFNVERRLPRREAGAVADPKDMGVDCKRFLTPRGVEDHVGGLTAHSRQRFEQLARARNLAAMVADQRLAERDHVLRLGIEQPDRLDCLAQRLLAEIDHRPRSPDPLEQVASGEIDAGVGCLRRQNDRDQQRIGTDEVELGRRRRIGFGEPAEEFENLGFRHNSPITSRIE